MKHFILPFIALGITLLYLLSQVSENTEFYGESYRVIFGLNILLVFGLLGLISHQLLTLKRKLKARIFGSKLTLKLVSLFALMAILPGVLVYGVSVQFLTRSIESWFDIKVEHALDGGMRISRTASSYFLRELVRKGQLVAAEITVNHTTSTNDVKYLNHLREQHGIEEINLFNTHGQLIASATNGEKNVYTLFPNGSVLKRIRHQESFSSLENIPGRGLYLRVVVPVNILSLREDIRILQLLQPLPHDLTHDTELVHAGARDYQGLSLARDGLRQLYGLTLTLTLLLSLLLAIVVAFFLSNRLIAPLSILNKGTQAIAQGDFTPVQSESKNDDELGTLMRSFNTMARQLADATTYAERNRLQLETAKAYLENILANLSAGVLAFDEGLVLRTANPSAWAIMNLDLPALRDIHLDEWGSCDPALADFATQIQYEFQEHGMQPWQKQIEYRHTDKTKVLLMRGTRLPVDTDHGYILVFDDITDLLQAQRDSAWGEVARRLAHEIKNPLTPIQLSAERIQHKLSHHLDETNAAFLMRATTTIINQVSALKTMVNAFSEYARSPKLNIEKLQLNQLVNDVLALYENIPIQLKTELYTPLPAMMGDVTLLRQVIHNLLKNAQEALNQQENPQITLITQLHPKNKKQIELIIQDNGTGFSDTILTRAFEPYVTTKAKGTGLGLPIVKKIIDEHKGSIQLENAKPSGALVRITFPILEGSSANE